MVSRRFDRMFGTLVGKFKVFQGTPRNPSEITELTSAWIELDDARQEIRGEAMQRLRELRQLRYEDPDAYRDAVRRRDVIAPGSQAGLGILQ